MTRSLVTYVALMIGLISLSAPLAAQQTELDRAALVHALSRLSFGVTDELLAEVQEQGYEAWLDAQLNARGPDRACAEILSRYPTLNLSSAEIYAGYMSLPEDAKNRRQMEYRARTDLRFSLVHRAAISRHQIQEVMADFWRNHLNVDRNKDAVEILATEWDREVIRQHVFGKFHDMLLASAQHPAMLIYLDQHLSRRPPNKTELKDVARRVRRKTGSRERGAEAARIAEQKGLNENYARELLELHTLGVDRGYTQKDVIAVAEALTGWSVDGAENRWRFQYRDDMHVHGPKFILGKTIPRQKRRHGVREGEMIIRRLASHRATSLFLAEKLCTYLVADQPPQSIVDSTAERLRATDFDLKEAVRHVATSSEFFDPRHRRGKFKTPLEFVVSALRVTGAEIENPRVLLETLKEMGQPVYACEDPTGYRDVSESWRDPGVMTARWRFALDLARDRIKGVKVPAHVYADLKGKNRFLVIRRLGERVLPGGMRKETIAFCTRAATRWEKARRRHAEAVSGGKKKGEKRPPAPLPLERYLLGVLLGSPEFQEQ